MRIKLKVGFAGYPAGKEINIDDDKGIPTSHFWRRRLKDAEIDKSIEIVQTKETLKTKQKSKPVKGNSNDNES